MDSNDVIKDVLAIIGVITVVIWPIKLLSDVLPKLSNLKSKFWKFMSSKIRHKILEKKAIASNIECVVNDVVADLKHELPDGWINKASIKWVNKDITNEIEDEEMILRIRPLKSQDFNLMNGVFYFFSKALFPETKEVIPTAIRKASALHLSRRTISKKQPYITKIFEKNFIEKAIEIDSNVANYIGDYEIIDRHGFFTSTYLRELHKIADNVRYNEMRSRIEEEFKNILEHIKKFIKTSPNSPDSLWWRKGQVNSYAFLLVAKPFHPSFKPYLKRVNEHSSREIERLYVMGANQEKSFVKRVIKEIEKGTNYNLLELFELYRDYREESGGIGAIFDAKALQKENNEIIDKFFNERDECQ